ncbi:hypothetical protein AVEN_67798-1 [Araneus ventricosus]|uniref:Uncharacterized protein n=1 Tax=Araneus ventricosus TaxID=182803 RepID=A0A4Y2J772_ARAVE|nr:hypothetical protein AVEN_67798-1 [Araneus ventricosus]
MREVGNVSTTAYPELGARRLLIGRMGMREVLVKSLSKKIFLQNMRYITRNIAVISLMSFLILLRESWFFIVSCHRCCSRCIGLPTSQKPQLSVDCRWNILNLDVEGLWPMGTMTDD